MTEQEKKQLRLIAKLAIERLFVDSLSDEESELYTALQVEPEFTKFCNAGLMEALQEAEFQDVITNEAPVTMSVRQLLATVTASITIGMDLAIMMSRYGAKFPMPKPN